MEIKSKYETLCKTGCGRCPQLMRKHGTAICLASGNFLDEKPVYFRTADDGWAEYPPAPVPNENCAFNW